MSVRKLTRNQFAHRLWRSICSLADAYSLHGDRRTFQGLLGHRRELWTHNSLIYAKLA